MWKWGLNFHVVIPLNVVSVKFIKKNILIYTKNHKWFIKRNDVVFNI